MTAAAEQASEGRLAQPWYATGDGWSLELEGMEQAASLYSETVCSLANGYMGYRGYREERDDRKPGYREGYLAGVFAELPPNARKLVVHQFEWPSLQMVSLPEIFGAVIVLGGELFDPAVGEVEEYRQLLNLLEATLQRTVCWRSSTGKVSRLWFTRLLSAAVPQLALQRIEIEAVNWSGEAEVSWETDLGQPTVFRCGDPGRPNPPCVALEPEAAFADGALVGGRMRTVGTGHRIQVMAQVSGGDASGHIHGGRVLTQAVRTQLQAGYPATLERMAVVLCDRNRAACDLPGDARQLLAQAHEQGWDGCHGAHIACWQQRWQDADIEIAGNPRDQALVRFGIFSLLQVAPYHAADLSIPARFYAFNRYNGLYFWDCEIFLLPFYQYCQPAVARNLLEFRSRTLEGARRNARALGGTGALFPWQGDADSGLEQAPWGLHAFLWHQTADIVYAFDQYLRATNDQQFLEQHAAQVFAETARFWCHRLELGADGAWHLHGTVGPDEADEHGPDNGYTCLLVRHCLEASAKGCAQVEGVATEDELRQWQELAAAIHIPEVPGLPGVPLQDAFLLQRRKEDISAMTVEEFWQRRHEVQVIKQADILLAMYLLQDCFSAAQLHDAYAFYEPMTLHVSSLSYNTHSIVAARLGMHAPAYDYFRRAAGLDMDNIRNATKDGLHAAALGGVWQMVMNGFVGLMIDPQDGLRIAPRLPEQWQLLRTRLWYRNWQLELQIGEGELAVRVLQQGDPGARLILDGETVILEAAATFNVALSALHA